MAGFVVNLYEKYRLSLNSFDQYIYNEARRNILQIRISNIKLSYVETISVVLPS